MNSTPGITNHSMEGGTAGNIVAQGTVEITYNSNKIHANCNPIVSINGCDIAPDRGPVAVAVNGVPFYGPEDGPGGVL